MKRFLLLSLCFLIIFVTSCTIDNKVEMIKESIVEEPAPAVEENKPEDYIMELKPIKLFSNYVVAPNVVYGINGVSLEKIALGDLANIVWNFDSFFMVGDRKYLTIKIPISGDPIPDTDPVQYKVAYEIHYFEQIKNDISEITEADFPTFPASEHIEFEGNNFKIETTPSDIDGVSTFTSRVYQGLLVIGYLKIDGYVLVENGLWFSVAETIKTRLEGVYLWAIDGSSPNRVLESGRIF